MLTRLRHIFPPLLAAPMALLLSVLAGCVGDSLDPLCPADGGEKATLLLHVNAVGSAAATTGGSRALADYTPATLGANPAAVEAMEAAVNSVRVLVFHPDGSLEANSLFSDFASGSYWTGNIEVQANEAKTLYFIANEATLGPAASTALAANDLTVAKMEQMAFAPTTDAAGFAEKGFPMTACYSMATVASAGYTQVDVSLVRAATKWTFNFINKRTKAIDVTGLTVGSFADRTWLLPHFSVGGTAYSSDRFYVKPTTSSPSTPDAGTCLDGASGGQFWIDWLERAVALSHADNGEKPDDIGWISQYTLPDGAAHGQKISYSGSLPVEPEATSSLVFYQSESAYPAAGSPQAYTIEALTISDGEKSVTFPRAGDPNDETARQLSKLKYLFRNTHVIVNIIVNEVAFDVVVEVEPYLLSDPVVASFGIARDEYGNIYAKYPDPTNPDLIHKVKLKESNSIVFTRQDKTYAEDGVTVATQTTVFYTLDPTTAARVDLAPTAAANTNWTTYAAANTTVEWEPLQFVLDNGECRRNSDGKIVYFTETAVGTKNYYIIGAKGQVEPTDQWGENGNTLLVP